MTVGNALDPFDRLLEMVDAALPAEGVEGLCQHGVSAVRPRGLKHVPILTRPEFDSELCRADVVLCHAGVGTLWSAIEAGHHPLVVPRREHLGEHVNDHQLEICAALEPEGLIRVVSTTHELAAALRSTTRVPEQRPLDQSALRRIGDALGALGRSRRRARPWLLRLLQFGSPPLERMRFR
ncbi:MAG: hypothetical protein KJ015_19500 [Myxococcales bacterium]|nr:hypothetical protein [Myxococcales bacterium]